MYYTGNDTVKKGIMDIGLKEFTERYPEEDFCFGFLDNIDMIKSDVVTGYASNVLTVGIHSATTGRAGYISIGLNGSEKTEVRLYSEGKEVTSNEEGYNKLRDWVFSEMESTLL